jgi:hypothetical protein
VLLLLSACCRGLHVLLQCAHRVLLLPLLLQQQ